MSKFYNSIKSLYIDMRTNNVFFQTFSIKFNNVNADCIFSIQDEPFELIFIRKSDAQVMKIDIKKGFTLDIQNKFSEFYKFFNIRYGKGNFSLISFLDYLSSKIPKNVDILSNDERRLIYNSIEIEDSKKIYYLSLTNWDKVNLGKVKKVGTRSAKNLAKTQLLFPHIYEAVKDKDISINYSSKPTGKKFELKDLD
ncbi:hypothetical protein KYI09_11100 (plasmid) [Macrococcoides caseolyticum]|uniref:DUF6037 family protein n=1 Tax=Macrococcoides caseolyticum TaxID=69966 RepID=UPI001C5F46DF|nr:DUF6037 family protein [Macrococcus caseolyticus]QYA41193.1 hypothetical protein KYI09_11100 [Macrococcus caseolyticus]